MAKKIIVLGAGLVGSAMAIDLKNSGHDVISADLNPKALEALGAKHGIRTKCENFMDPAVLKELLRDIDLVVGAAPGSLGFELMKQVICEGKNMVDISFCPEDYLQLDSLAREYGVTVVGDMGVAPGMCNAILGYHDAHMDIDSYKCIVGGLPDKRVWPLEYKSSWSPIDCIEEYIRPARFMQNGKLIVKPALSDTELVDFEELGTLEEWNSDGLRSLLQTMSHIPNMVEKTLRYPGTIDYVKVLRELGYFSYDEIEVSGKMIRPIDLSAKLLFPKWKLEHGESEFTIMRINITGTQAGKEKNYQYDLYDKYEPSTGMLSMSRTTGFTCTAVATLLLNGMLLEKGVFAPEQISADARNFEFLVGYLEERNVVYRVSSW